MLLYTFAMQYFHSIRIAIVLFFCIKCIYSEEIVPNSGLTKNNGNITEEQILLGQKKVSEQIMDILDHYKQEDPVGLPGIPIPDPMPIPDMRHSFSVATMNFKTVNVQGLSKFRIEKIQSNLAQMKGQISLRIAQLIIKGKHTISTWLSRSSGDFNVTLQNVLVTGIANLEVNRAGQLEASDINMDITFQSIAMNFQNLGLMGTLFQGIINSVGTFLFDSIKPFILSEVNTNVRGDINKQIMEIPQRFPNSIPPLDMAVAELRKTVRNAGYDPYKVPDYNYTTGIMGVYLTHTWVTGLASFYRVGNITVTMDNNTLHVGIHVGSQRVRGSCLWEMAFAGYLSKAGSSSFTIEYIQVDVLIAQSMDVRKRPKLEDLNLKLGNIQARIDGTGTMDYVVELIVNILPNILRYQIVDALENPLKTRLQSIMDEIDVEKLVEEHLPTIDQIADTKPS